MNKQAAKEFLKQFAKDEILEVLTESFRFERIANDMCMILYERKSQSLLDEMDRNAKKTESCKTWQEAAQAHHEFKKLDRQLERLNAKFDKLSKKSQKTGR